MFIFDQVANGDEIRIDWCSIAWREFDEGKIQNIEGYPCWVWGC